MNGASINRDAAAVAAAHAIRYPQAMKRVHPRLRRAALALAAAAVALGGFRLALPSIAKARINTKLAALPEGWSGKLNRVSMSLLRGEFAVHALELENPKKDMSLRLHAGRLNVEWGPLLRGEVVARARIEAPKARVVLERKGKAELEEKKPVEPKRLPDLEKLLPFRLDRIELDDGEIIVRAGEAELALKEMKFTAENLTNRPKGEARARYAKGMASARETSGGSIGIRFAVDPTADKPAFHVEFEIGEIDLAKLNPILLFQFGVDVDRGRFSLAGEADAKDGAFQGYVKPYVDDLKMGPTHGAEKGPVKIIKETAAAVVAAVLKNKDTKAVATKAPFKGRFENPEVGTWEALVAVLRNAFVEALRPTLERGR